MQDERFWQAVVARDRSFDGQFWYGVRTTGIFCKPSCASRQPRRANVSFFADSAAAVAAGFRPCRRCRPDDPDTPDAQTALVQQICAYLDTADEGIPTLEALGAQFHVSPYHLQRVFKRIVGVSPRQYAATRRDERLKQELRRASDVTTAVYEAGYGSSSSFYAQAAETLGMAPAIYRTGGFMTTMTYTIAPSPLGYLLVAATERGVSKISLGTSEAALEQDLRAEFPQAVTSRNDAALAANVAEIVAYLRGEQPSLALPLDVQATAFQRQVWEALRRIPYGTTVSYAQLASQIGRPTAARAVARACATNPAALVIPCHRVVREDGHLGGYRWGMDRKAQILATEHAHAASPVS